MKFTSVAIVAWWAVANVFPVPQFAQMLFFDHAHAAISTVVLLLAEEHPVLAVPARVIWKSVFIRLNSEQQLVIKANSSPAAYRTDSCM